MKICTSCQIEKPLTEFYTYRYANRAPYPYARCKDCHKKRLYADPDKAKRRRAHRLSVREWVDEVKNVPCTDCGVQYPPYVMDFDHVLPGKVRSIAALVARASRAAVEAEIAKCEVVCANCHRERTHARMVS